MKRSIRPEGRTGRPLPDPSGHRSERQRHQRGTASLGRRMVEPVLHGLMLSDFSMNLENPSSLVQCAGATRCKRSL